MKGFYIEVSNNLLNPQHCKRMGDSVWLFMWFLDKMTSVNDQKGKVLGGKPIKFSDIKKDLGISRSTYNRWMKILKDGGYVQTLRTPYGSCIVVLKAKKRFNKDVTDESKETHPDESKEIQGTCSNNESSLSTENESSVNRERDISASEMNHVIKTVAVDITVDNSNYYPTGPSDTVGVDENLRPSDSFTSMVKKSMRYEKIEDVPEKEVSDGIALFLPVFPDQFTTKNPFAVMPNRMAVKKVLMRLTLDELKDIITKYVSKKDDKFRPEAATIATFCNFKLDRIEAYVSKSAGGLWAHRSISTPEQAKVRDLQYQEVIDKVEQKTRLAKEKWAREHPNNN